MVGTTNIDWVQMTDTAIVEQIGQYIKQTRLGLNRTQEQLAKNSGLNRWTISKVENGESITLASLIQILRALDTLYVFDTFKVADEISPLAYAKLKKEQRERASSKRNKSTDHREDVTW